MELVYLWVEEYKNIKKQGFNFSPKFECKYDENTNELTIDEKKDYISIFPDNINITAIVGENGSGKSSLIELINNYIFIDRHPIKKINKNLSEKYIFIYWSNEEQKLYTVNKSDITIITNLKNEMKDYLQDIKSSIFNQDRDALFSEYNHIEYSELVIKDYKKPKEHLERNINESELSTLEKRNIFYKNKNFISKLISFFKKEDSFFGIDYFQPNEIYLNTKPLNGHSLVEKIISKINLKLDYEIKPLLVVTDQIRLRVFTESQIEKIRKHEDVINKIFQQSETFYLFKLNLDENISKEILDDILTELSSLDLLEIFDSSKKYYYKEHNMELGFNFKHLSSGEKNTIKLLLDIYSFFQADTYQNKIIILDEPINDSHPNWQKKFIKILTDFLNKYSNGKNVFIYITTHSPFILSDIPKENVLFLEKGVQKYRFKNSQTFGANIHTLLSDGFFMSDGLMGEFAKGKIQSIIKYHDKIITKELLKEENTQLRESEKDRYSREFKSNFWNIQSIIGDDYLKQVVKNHLIEIEKIVLGNDEAKEEEIKRLESQIKELRK